MSQAIQAGIAKLQAQLTALESAGAATTDGAEFSELLENVKSLVADIKVAGDPSGAGGSKWTLAETWAVLTELADVSQRVISLWSKVFPAQGSAAK